MVRVTRTCLTSGTCKCRCAFCKKLLSVSMAARKDFEKVYDSCILSFITVPRLPVVSKEPGSVDVGSNAFFNTVSIYRVAPPDNIKKGNLLCGEKQQF